MNWLEWLATVFAGTWFLGAVFSAGLIWEREYLGDNPTRRSGAWWGGYVVMAMAWPWMLALWPSSRPVPPSQPDEDDGYLGAISEGVYIPPVSTVDTAHTLALVRNPPLGEKILVVDQGLLLVRDTTGWSAVECGCRYNFSGFPVVLCRQHRSDVDPQGEPDDSEEEVGR